MARRPTLTRPRQLVLATLVVGCALSLSVSAVLLRTGGWGDPPPAEVDPHFHPRADGDDIAFVQDTARVVSDAKGDPPVVKGNGHPGAAGAPVTAAEADAMDIPAGERVRIARLVQALPSAEAAEIKRLMAEAAVKGGMDATTRGRVDELLARAAVLESRENARLRKERAAAMQRARLEARALEQERHRRLEKANPNGGVPSQRELILVPPETKEEADIHVITKLMGAVNDASVRTSHAYFLQQQRFRDDPLGLTLPADDATSDDLDSGDTDGSSSCAGDDPHCLDGLK